MRTFRKAAAVLMLVSFIFAAAAPAMAGIKINYDGTIYTGQGGSDSVAMGDGTTASGGQSTAMGDYTTASGWASTAMGRNSIASGGYSISTGYGSVASGKGSFAGGGDVTAKTVGGKAYETSSFAFGAGAVAGVSGGSNGGQIAMGINAKATHANSVALGNGSVTVAANTIAVGSSSSQRRITGVANGTADTDAATYGQVKGATQITDAHNYYTGTTSSPKTVKDAVNAVDKALGKTTTGNYIGASDAAGTNTIAAQIKKLDDGLGAKITSDGNVIKKSGTNTINQNISALDTAIGNRDYTNTTGYLLTTDGETITASLEKLNSGIGNRSYSHTTTAGGYLTNGATITASLNALNENMIKSMTVNADGTITAEQVDGSTDIVSNAIHDYRVTGGAYNATAKAVDVTLTDKYGTATEKVALTGIDTSRVVAADSGTEQTLAGGTKTTIAGGKATTSSTKNITTKVTADGGNATVEVALNDDVTINKLVANTSVTAGTGSNKVILADNSVKVGTGAELNSTQLTIGGTGAASLTSTSLTIGTTSLGTTNLTLGGVDFANASGGQVALTNVASAGKITGINTNATNAKDLYDFTYAKATIDSMIHDGDKFAVLYDNADQDRLNSITLAGGDTSQPVAIKNVASAGELSGTNSNAATGADIFKETRVSADGNYNYIAFTNTAADNLKALDAAMTGGYSLAADNVSEGNAISVNKKLSLNGLASAKAGITNIYTTLTKDTDGNAAIEVALGEHISVTDVTTGETVMNNNGVSITDGTNPAINTALAKTGLTVADGTNTTTVTSSGINTKEITTETLTVNGTAVFNAGADMNGNKITNVKDGEIAENSKDAVNGGQVYGLLHGSEKIEANTVTITESGQIDAADEKAVNGSKLYAELRAGADGNYTSKDTATAANLKALDTAIGAKQNGSYIMDGESASVYSNLKTLDENLFRIDETTDAKRFKAEDAAAQATGKGATALGFGNTAKGEKSTAVGYGNAVTGNKSGAFGDPNIVEADASYAYGNDNKIYTTETGIGSSHVIGNNNHVKADNTFVLGNSVGTAEKPVTANNSVILGNGSTAEEDNVVSVGTEGKERKIIHVADGTIAEGSKDAVNGGQVYKLVGQSVTEERTRAQTVERHLQNEINANTQEIREVGAISAALAGLHFAEPSGEAGDKLVGAVAYGGYRGANAEAIGIAYKPSPNMMLSASTSISNGNDSQNAYNVGFSLKFGKGETAKTKAELQKQVKYLNEKNSTLESTVAQQGDTIVQQGAEIQTLRSELEELKKLIKK